MNKAILILYNQICNIVTKSEKFSDECIIYDLVTEWYYMVKNF